MTQAGPWNTKQQHTYLVQNVWNRTNFTDANCVRLLEQTKQSKRKAVGIFWSSHYKLTRTRDRFDSVSLTIEENLSSQLIEKRPQFLQFNKAQLRMENSFKSVKTEDELSWQTRLR